MNETLIPIYDVVFNGEDNLGVTAISFVDYPAIGVDFLTMKEDTPIKLVLREEERRVISPVLLPEKLIYRRNETCEFYIKFSADVIDKLAWNYYIEDKLNNVTVMHNGLGLIPGVECIDLWIIEDSNDVMYKTYNFSESEVPVGSWCMDYKVNNQELWDNIKSGELRGLSIEAYLNFK